MYTSNTALRKITKEQIKIIYTLGNELGIVDRTANRDSLHELIESITGETHVSELSCMQANNVISRLKGNMKGTKAFRHNHPKPKEPVEVSDMASIAQKNKIWRLMYELQGYDKTETSATLNERLRGFLRKYGGIDDMRFLTAAQAWRVIEGLKGVVKSAENKKGGEKT